LTVLCFVYYIDLVRRKKMSDDIRSFQDINPTAGNLGDKDSFTRGAAREINRTRAQDIRATATRRGGGDWSSASKVMLDGFRPSSEIGVVRGIGLGGLGSINFAAVVQSLHKELDYG
jgi:hypothetical protein